MKKQFLFLTIAMTAFSGLQTMESNLSNDNTNYNANNENQIVDAEVKSLKNRCLSLVANELIKTENLTLFLNNPIGFIQTQQEKYPSEIAEQLASKILFLVKPELLKVAEFKDHDYPVNNIAFSNDDQFFASVSDDFSLFVYSYDEQGNYIVKQNLKNSMSSFLSVAFSADSNSLAAGLANGYIWLLVLENGEYKIINKFKAHNKNVNSIVFSSDGHYLATASNDKTIHLWDLKAFGNDTNPKLIQTFNHNSAVNSVMFSPDCNLLAFGTDEEAGLYELNNLNNNSPIKFAENSKVMSVVFSSDNQFYTIASENHIHIYNRDENEKYQLNQIIKTDPSIQSLAFSSDNYFLAAGSSDMSVKLYALDNNNEYFFIGKLQGHTNIVTAVTFTSNDYLVSASTDETIQFHDIKFGTKKISLEQSLLIAGLLLNVINKNNIILNKSLNNIYQSLPASIKNHLGLESTEELMEYSL